MSADPEVPPLVRIHSECFTGDVLGSERCDCGPQLLEAVRRIAQVGGLLLYLRQEGRGIGLYAKLDAYGLQDAGLDTYDANLALGYSEDGRDYTVAAQMLGALGLDRVALLSNNPDKGAQLDRLGVTVAERVPTAVHLNATKPHRPKVRDPIGSELHEVTDLVRSFTGGFTEQSMKATPVVRTPRGLPQARRRPTAHQPMNTHLRPHPRMRPDHDCYEDCHQPRTPLDGDWFT